jgi:hypothetical protein
VVDPLTCAQRDVTVRAREAAEERERDPLDYAQRPVRLDVDDDVGRGEAEALGVGGGGEEEEQRDGGNSGRATAQNATRGASRAGSSISKKSRRPKLKSPASTFVGTV